jgi:hypothetical protein
MFLAALVYLKFKRLEDRIASLTTELALQTWDRELALDPIEQPDPRPSGAADQR